MNGRRLGVRPKAQNPAYRPSDKFSLLFALKGCRLGTTLPPIPHPTNSHKAPPVKSGPYPKNSYPQAFQQPFLAFENLMFLRIKKEHMGVFKGTYDQNKPLTSLFQSHSQHR
jgi:hypothetical protein